MKIIGKVVLSVLVAGTGAGFAGEATNVTWKSSLSAGVTYKSGNTEKTLYTANLKGERRSDKTDLIASLYGEYGTTEDSVGVESTTEGQLRGQAELRWKFDGKLYAAINTEVLHDALKDISYRVGIGPNIGYYLIDKKTQRLDVSVGLNEVVERVAGVEDDYATVRLAEKYDWKISETANFYFNTEFNARAEDVEDNTSLFITGVKSKVNGQLSIFVELRDEYDSRPTAGVKHNDSTLMAGLNYEF